MFTGIIQFQVLVQNVSSDPKGLGVVLQTSRPLPHNQSSTPKSLLKTLFAPFSQLLFSPNRPLKYFELGESIALNGVCLTLTRQTSKSWYFDLSTETLNKSTFKTVVPGATLNGERALTLGAYLGGHMVSGHTDGIGEVKDQVFYESEGQQFSTLIVAIPSNYQAELILKGSISLNGVSLTIAEINQSNISIALIPTTLKSTNLVGLKAGDKVNFETDLIAKYVKNIMSHYQHTDIVSSIPQSNNNPHPIQDQKVEV